MSSQRDPRAYLEDIERACGLVLRFSAGHSLATYEADEMLRSAVERQFQIVGEALILLRRHAPQLAAEVSDVERIIGFRHVIVHGYDTLDDETVWGIVVTRVAQLTDQVRELLDRLDPSR